MQIPHHAYTPFYEGRAVVFFPISSSILSIMYSVWPESTSQLTGSYWLFIGISDYIEALISASEQPGTCWMSTIYLLTKS